MGKKRCTAKLQRYLGYQMHIRPSNCERLLNCNLSIWLPKKEKTAKQEKYLEERSKEHERLAKGEFLDTEVKCQEYYEFVKNICGKNFFIEETLKTDFEGTEFKGTPDLFGYAEKTKEVYLIDYKTGFWKVSSWYNPQLMAYAGLIKAVKKKWKIEQFHLSILNTQSDFLHSFSPKMETIDDHMDRIAQSIDFFRQETAYGKKGDWCKFCPSKESCPLLNHKTI